jgi:hypothetical protein
VESFLVAVGLIGVVLNLVAYGLLTTGRLQPTDTRYQWMNVFGTVGILLSLMVQWNLPSFILNAAWMLIGVVALMRLRRARRVMK